MKAYFSKLKLSRVNVILYVAAALAITAKLLSAPPVHINNINFDVAAYNNFLIFKLSGYNLLNELPLYISNDPIHYDLFKYSPTCALAFVPFYYLPNVFGLALWSLINVMLPFWAIHQIIGLHAKTRNLLILLLLAESITSLLNAQSNGLVLGLLLWAISAFQREKVGQVVILILFSGFIKIFGWLFFFLFLLKPRLIPKGILLGLTYGTTLLLLPLIWVRSEYLISEYRWWLLLLQQDSGTYVKLSFMGWFQAWFGVLLPKNIVLLGALFLQLAAIIWIAFYKQNAPNSNRKIVQMGSALLVWVVLFNHMSESATYVIALGGIVLFFSGDTEERSRIPVFILTAVLLFAVLGPTDIYPKWLRYWIVETAQLKAFSILLAWLWMLKSSVFPLRPID